MNNDGHNIYSRTAQRLEGTAKTTLLAKRKRFRDGLDTGTSAEVDLIAPTTSLVIPVLNNAHILQIPAVTTPVTATTVREIATTATTVTANIQPANPVDLIVPTTSLVIPVLNDIHILQIPAVTTPVTATTVIATTVREIATTATTVTANIQPANPGVPKLITLTGELTTLEQSFVRDTGTRLTKDGKSVNQNYLKTAYEAAHKGYSRDADVLKRYWNNYKDSKTFKSMKKNIVRK